MIKLPRTKEKYPTVTTRPSNLLPSPTSKNAKSESDHIKITITAANPRASTYIGGTAIHHSISTRSGEKKNHISEKKQWGRGSTPHTPSILGRWRGEEEEKPSSAAAADKSIAGKWRGWRRGRRWCAWPSSPSRRRDTMVWLGWDLGLLDCSIARCCCAVLVLGSLHLGVGGKSRWPCSWLSIGRICGVLDSFVTSGIAALWFCFWSLGWTAEAGHCAHYVCVKRKSMSRMFGCIAVWPGKAASWLLLWANLSDLLVVLNVSSAIWTCFDEKDCFSMIFSCHFVGFEWFLKRG